MKDALAFTLTLFLIYAALYPESAGQIVHRFNMAEFPQDHPLEIKNP